MENKKLFKWIRN